MSLLSIQDGTNQLLKSIDSLNDSVKKMDKSSERNSKVMFDLTLVMLFVAVMQILIFLILPENSSYYIKITCTVIFLFATIFLLLKLLKK